MLSPDVNVAWKLYDPAASGPFVFEFGAAPPLRAPPPAEVPVPAVQLPLLKKVYATDPVAEKPSDGVTVDVSYAEAPVASVPVQAAFVPASNTVVAVELVPVLTLNGSHELVEPVWFPSLGVNAPSKLYEP